MGLRFRKSASLGKGLRFTISKKGVGFSSGIKGFRITKKAGGGFRTTASVPGTGLSYTKDFGHGRNKSHSSRSSRFSLWSFYGGNHGFVWWLLIGWWLWIFLLYFYLLFGLVSLIIKAVKFILTSNTNRAQNDYTEKSFNKDPNNNTLQIIITVALIIFSLVVISACFGNSSDTEKNLPSSSESKSNIESSEPQEPDESSGLQEESSSEPASNHITAFEFPSYTNFTIDISVGNKESGSFEVVGTGDFDPDDIEFVSSNESVAIIEFDEYRELFGDVYYTITPISDGTATLYVQTKDGSVKSQEITINVKGSKLTDLSFASSVRSEIRLNLGDTETVTVNVKGINVEDLDINKIVFISTNESVAIIEYKEIDSGFLSNNIICKIKAISEGETTVKVASKDGGVSTKKIKIIVEAPETKPETKPSTTPSEKKYTYVGNKNTKVFHYDSCSYVKRMSSSNKDTQTTTREKMISQGYNPCDKCNP